MVKGGRRRNADEVERIVADFEGSGLSRREYCERHGIAAPTLDWYRRRVRVRRSSPNLVAVRLKETAASCVTVGASTGFALVLGNGRRIETGWGFDENQLRQLIRIAGAA
jgi:hypothetical protein